jgi:hypothetical protein
MSTVSDDVAIQPPLSDGLNPVAALKANGEQL